MAPVLTRRQSLRCLAAGTAATLGSRWLSAAEPRIVKKTFVYKTVGGLEIRADVYRPDDNVLRPVAMWIHGGALILGSRSGVNGRVKQSFLDAGYALVSIDYRLAPETKLPQILSDVEDACAWVRSEGRKRFGADTGRLAVLGGSAGGYLTLTTGYRVKPPPDVLVAFWGYGDIAGSWYSQPSSFYRRRPLVSSQDAYRAVSGPPLTDGSTGGNQRAAFYLYCRQQGLWPKEVAGYDPVKQSERFDPFCPLRNVTADFPPTLLIHGDQDTDVPHQQSVVMAEALSRHGVEHRFISIAGAGHGLSQGDPKLVQQAYDAVLPFVEKQMRGQ